MRAVLGGTYGGADEFTSQDLAPASSYLTDRVSQFMPTSVYKCLDRKPWLVYQIRGDNCAFENFTQALVSVGVAVKPRSAKCLKKFILASHW
jgi:hypothetical protein